MNPVFTGLIIYFFLIFIFRLSGKKTLSQTSPFELVLLLIISEVTQQALLGKDYSLTASFILIVTLIGTDYLLGILRTKWKYFDKLTEGLPLIIAENGQLLEDRMKKTKVEKSDVMEAARQKQGLERMDQIKYAVLEKDGSISIIPKQK